MYQDSRNLIYQLEDIMSIKLEEAEQTEEYSSVFFIPDNLRHPFIINRYHANQNSGSIAQISLVATLGKISSNIPSSVVLELLSFNLITATYIGPKLSYSKNTQMLTLISCISPSEPEVLTVYDLHEEIKQLLEHATMINNKLYEQGYPLSDDV